MSDNFIVKLTGNIHDFTEYTLLIPCVSIGNVPQLTCDLLISTLLDDKRGDSSGRFVFIGHIYSDNVMPLSGPDPYTFGGQNIATSMQLFGCESKKLMILQQRSPCFKELRNEFTESLISWIHKSHFKRLIILSSSFIEHFPDNLDTDERFPIRYMSNEHASRDDINELETNLNIRVIEKVDPIYLTPLSNGTVHLPGSGLLKSLMKRIKQMPVLALIMYCSEGDNTPHAKVLAEKVNQWIKIIDVSEGSLPWIEPFSWRQMFGHKFPASMF